MSNHDTVDFTFRATKLDKKVLRLFEIINFTSGVKYSISLLQLNCTSHIGYIHIIHMAISTIF